MDKDSKILVGLNRSAKGKVPSEYMGIYEFKFSNYEVTVEELKKYIQVGWGFCCALKGRRKDSNFVSAQHIGLDFDTEDDRSTIDSLMQWPVIRDYANFIYTTASHTADKPRARVVFILDEPITDPEEYRRLALGLNALFPFVDRRADPARIWFGSENCEIRDIGNFLPLDWLQSQALTPPAPKEEEHNNEETPEAPKPVKESKKKKPAPIALWKVELALASLKNERAEDYGDWINVGLALRALGPMGLELWDKWSKRSKKYQEGVCSSKWPGLFEEKKNSLSIGSLYYWAVQDGSPNFLPDCPPDAEPIHYKAALERMGLKLRLNIMDDRIYLGDEPLSDVHYNRILYLVGNFGYSSRVKMDYAVHALALENVFHPIRDYLNGLEWDGFDHIDKLCGYVYDQQGIFPVVFRHWLLGAVRRILGTPPGEFSPMMVIHADQNSGKSYFARWLCSGLPDFYAEGPINPENKDMSIRRRSLFLWEVAELEATTKKADVAALKDFLTDQVILERVPYGHFETRKPPTVSYIGTINGDSFLADTTGNRRYNICRVKSINWNYAKECNVNQVWAQAVAIYKEIGVPDLALEEKGRVEEVREGFETADPLIAAIESIFNIDLSTPQNRMTSYDIIQRLLESDTDGHLRLSLTLPEAARVSRALTKLGLDKRRIEIKGKQSWWWEGISPRGYVVNEIVSGTANGIDWGNKV